MLVHRTSLSSIGLIKSYLPLNFVQRSRRCFSSVRPCENSSTKSISNLVEVEEIEIKVPWGVIAGKWWGPKNVRPILSLHGWQDNAGSFDTLIPLLPRELSYLALDHPGHGLSSRLPHGLYYSTAHIIHCINMLRKQFNWEKISLLSHSMSGVVSFQYAAIFPETVDLVIALDALKPMQAKPARVLDLLTKLGDEFHTIDLRNQENSPPPNYTYDEIIDRWEKGTSGSITKDVAPLLMKRSIAPAPHNPDRYYFTRDSRLKIFNFAMISHELCLEMTKRLKMPYLYFKADKSPFYENKRYFDEVVKSIQENNSQFEWHMVDGTHHVHLTDPIKISPIISEFLLKHRSSDC